MDNDWTTTPDITHVYEKFSSQAAERLQAKAAETIQKRAKLEQDIGGPYNLRPGFLIPPTQQLSGPIEPPIYVVYPASSPPEPVEEAHLYFSPAHSPGKGNHSIVYRVE